MTTHSRSCLLSLRGANIKQVMHALVLAWQLPPFAVQRWTATCQDAQRHLLKQ